MWRDILERGTFTPDDKKNAGTWEHCYIGELDSARVSAGLPSIMRLNVHGDNFGPADLTLNRLGWDFKTYVRANDARGAASIASAIDRRMIELGLYA